MTILILATALFTFSMGPSTPTSSDISDITSLVETFSKSADGRQVAKMESILHDSFRAIINRAFGSDKVDFIDKQTYLTLLREEKIGGDNRHISITSIDLEGNNAVVKAELAGKDYNFTTFIQTVKGADGKWKVMSDMPHIEKNK